MAINLITWAGQTVTPKYDAILQDICVGRSGILYGCDVSANYNVLTIGAGYGVIKGRLFEVTETTITVTIPQGSSDRILAIRLDLANVDRPIQIGVLQVGDQPTQDEAANYTNGVYELVLATFLMTPNGIRYLEQAESKLPYNRTPVYTSLADLAINVSNASNAYIPDIYNAMADGSIAILDQDDINGLPHSQTVGTVFVVRKTSTIGGCFFLTGTGYPNYKCDPDNTGGTWERLPWDGDIFYTMNETVTLRLSTAGFLTDNGQTVYVSVPMTRKVHYGRSLYFSEGQATIRQGGRYLAGSGSAMADLRLYDPEVYVYENEILLKLHSASGFGGTNNETVGVWGLVRVIEG